MLRISLRCKFKLIRSFLRLSWACSHFLIFPMQLFLNVLVFNILFPKGEEEENEEEQKGEKGIGSLKFLEVTSARRGRVCSNRRKGYNQDPRLFPSLWSEAAISNQIPSIQRTRCFSHPGSHKLYVSFSRNMYTVACYLAEGWGMGSCYCAKRWNDWN